MGLDHSKTDGNAVENQLQNFIQILSEASTIDEYVKSQLKKALSIYSDYFSRTPSSQSKTSCDMIKIAMNHLESIESTHDYVSTGPHGNVSWLEQLARTRSMMKIIKKRMKHNTSIPEEYDKDLRALSRLSQELDNISKYKNNKKLKEDKEEISVFFLELFVRSSAAYKPLHHKETAGKSEPKTEVFELDSVHPSHSLKGNCANTSPNSNSEFKAEHFVKNLKKLENEFKRVVSLGARTSLPKVHQKHDLDLELMRNSGDKLDGLNIEESANRSRQDLDRTRLRFDRNNHTAEPDIISKDNKYNEHTSRVPQHAEELTGDSTIEEDITSPLPVYNNLLEKITENVQQLCEQEQHLRSCFNNDLYKRLITGLEDQKQKLQKIPDINEDNIKSRKQHAMSTIDQIFKKAARIFRREKANCLSRLTCIQDRFSHIKDNYKNYSELEQHVNKCMLDLDNIELMDDEVINKNQVLQGQIRYLKEKLPETALAKLTQMIEFYRCFLESFSYSKHGYQYKEKHKEIVALKDHLSFLSNKNKELYANEIDSLLSLLEKKANKEEASKCLKQLREFEQEIGNLNYSCVLYEEKESNLRNLREQICLINNQDKRVIIKVNELSKKVSEMLIFGNDENRRRTKKSSEKMFVHGNTRKFCHKQQTFPMQTATTNNQSFIEISKPVTPEVKPSEGENVHLSYSGDIVREKTEATASNEKNQSSTGLYLAQVATVSDETDARSNSFEFGQPPEENTETSNERNEETSEYTLKITSYLPFIKSTVKASNLEKQEEIVVKEIKDTVGTFGSDPASNQKNAYPRKKEDTSQQEEMSVEKIEDVNGKHESHPTANQEASGVNSIDDKSLPGQLVSLDRDEDLSSDKNNEKTQTILDLRQHFNDFDPKKLKISKNSTEFIRFITERAQMYKGRVGSYSGTNYSVEYLVLDESLMNLLELLDDVKCYGDENLLKEKLATIGYINNLQEQLDENANE